MTDKNGFLSASALHLSESQRTTLIAVLERFESGRIKDLPRDPGDLIWNISNRPLDFFDYSQTRQDYECGTAGCILGWARELDPTNPRRYQFEGEFQRDNIPIELEILCFSNFPHDGHRMTVREAAAALRQYLTTGKGKWYGPHPQES